VSTLLRREVLAAGVAAAGASVAGCADVGRLWSGSAIPERFAAPTSETIDPDHHLLSRVTFGPRPGDRERVARIGRTAFIDEQLEIEEPGLAFRLLGDADVLSMDPSSLLELSPEHVERQIVSHALAAAVLSERQLHEVVVEAMGDHFHVAIAKGDCRHFLPADRRDVIRRHALGSFRDMLAASVLSPAMLVYLDGKDNVAASAPTGKVNENHARELLELHTLGVNGGYRQADVREVARCLTGFVVGTKWRPGEVEFVAERHDDGEKQVLGHTIPAGGGLTDVERVLDILVEHPSTARHVARRLCATFVADDPSEASIASAAATFTATRGDLRATTRSILLSDELAASAGAKVKRPFRFVASALRALGVLRGPSEATVDRLARMGHRPFAWPTPDGYPQSGLAFLPSLLARFQLAQLLSEGKLAGAPFEAERLVAACDGGQVFAHLVGRTPGPHEVEASRADPKRAIALALSSPAFQRT
jgi:uncharacterized protein (DUF1800 family)